MGAPAWGLPVGAGLQTGPQPRGPELPSAKSKGHRSPHSVGSSTDGNLLATGDQGEARRACGILSLTLGSGRWRARVPITDAPVC